MNELEQLRQEAEHLKNAIREGRKAACDTSLAQVKPQQCDLHKIAKSPIFVSNHYPYKQHICQCYIATVAISVSWEGSKKIART